MTIPATAPPLRLLLPLPPPPELSEDGPLLLPAAEVELLVAALLVVLSLAGVEVVVGCTDAVSLLVPWSVAAVVESGPGTDDDKGLAVSAGWPAEEDEAGAGGADVGGTSGAVEETGGGGGGTEEEVTTTGGGGVTDTGGVGATEETTGGKVGAVGMVVDGGSTGVTDTGGVAEVGSTATGAELEAVAAGGDGSPPPTEVATGVLAPAPAVVSAFCAFAVSAATSARADRLQTTR
ncbi:hypothetical protein EV174_003405, partial [Coemansia sp. RSA 2320]